MTKVNTKHYSTTYRHGNCLSKKTKLKQSVEQAGGGGGREEGGGQ